MVSPLTIFIILVISTTTRGVKTSCRVRVTANQQGFLICKFSKNIMTPQKHDFVVHRYYLNGNSSFEELLRCNWLKKELDCTTLPGYSFDKVVTDIIVVDIPKLTKAHEGKYVCQVLGNDDDDDEFCYFQDKGELHISSTQSSSGSQKTEVIGKETNGSDSPLPALENTSTAPLSRSAVDLHTHDNDTGHVGGTFQTLVVIVSVCMALLMLSAGGYYGRKTWQEYKKGRVRRSKEITEDGLTKDNVTSALARQNETTEGGNEQWLQEINKRVHEGIIQLVDILQRAIGNASTNGPRTGEIDDGYREFKPKRGFSNEGGDGGGGPYGLDLV